MRWDSNRVLRQFRSRARDLKALAVRGALAATCVLPASCAPDIKPSYDDPTPAARIGAIRNTAATQSRKDIPRLVENLANDDPAVRLAAIEALRRITGTTLGYSASAIRSERNAGIERWKAWLKDPANQVN